MLVKSVLASCDETSGDFEHKPMLLAEWRTIHDFSRHLANVGASQHLHFCWDSLQSNPVFSYVMPC